MLKIKDILSPELIVQLHRYGRIIAPKEVRDQYLDPKHKTLLLCIDHLHYCQADDNFENLTVDELNGRIDKWFGDIPDFPRVSLNGLDE